MKGDIMTIRFFGVFSLSALLFCALTVNPAAAQMTHVTGQPAAATAPALQPPAPSTPQPVPPPPTPTSTDELQQKLDAANAKVAELEGKLSICVDPHVVTSLQVQLTDAQKAVTKLSLEKSDLDHSATKLFSSRRLIVRIGLAVLFFFGLFAFYHYSLPHRRRRIIFVAVILGGLIGYLMIFPATLGAAVNNWKIDPYKVEPGVTADFTITGVGFGNDLSKINVVFSSDPTHGQPVLGVTKKSVNPKQIVITVVVPAGAPDSWRELWLDTGSGLKKTVLSLAIVPPAASTALDVADARYIQREIDPAFRSFLLGMTQYYGLDYKKLVGLLRSPKSGTSKEAVAMIESARQAQIFADDRFVVLKTRADAAQAQADAAKVAADAAQAKADRNSGSTSSSTSDPVSDEHIRQVAGEVVAPLRGQVQAVGDLAVVTAQSVQSVKGGHMIIGGGGLSQDVRKKLADAVKKYEASRRAATGSGVPVRMTPKQ
jgi:hypothetical protein